MLLPVFCISILLASCNSSSSSNAQQKTDEKITDIPASSHSKEALTTFQQGLTFFDAGDGIKARETFSKAIAQDPKFSLAYLMRANTAPSSKEFADDLAAAKANLDSASSWEKMYYEYYSTFVTADRNKGIEIAEKITTTYPDAARAQVDLGNAYSGNIQIDKARACYQKAIQLNPKWVGGYAALTNSYLFNDPIDLKKAEENALKLVELAPNSPGAEITLGDCYRAQNDFQKAKDAYAKAVQLDPSTPEAYYKEGHANTYLGKMDEARKNYADGGKHDISQLGANLNIANTYLYGGDHKTATKYLMDAYAKMDTSGAAKSKLANEKFTYLTTAATIDFHDGDAAHLKQLVPMIQPLEEQIYNDIATPEAKTLGQADMLNWEAMAAATEGKFDDAKAKAEEEKKMLESIKDNRKLEPYYFVMGVINLKQKKYADAVADLAKSDLTSVYNKYWSALANEGAGNKDKAMSLYKEVAAYNFNFVGNALVRNEVKKKLGVH